MRSKHVIATIVAATALVLAVGLLAIGILRLNGLPTRKEPTTTERVLARVTRRLAIPRAERDATNPVAFSDDVWAEARAHFADHCASCHGNDGSGKTEIGQNLYPKAPDMR